MPHRIVRTATTSHTEYYGDVHIDEVIARVRMGQARPDFDARRQSIHDFSAAISLQVEPLALLELVATDSGAFMTNRHLRIAVIGTLPAVAALVRDYTSIPLPKFDLRHFATLDEARDWLGLAA
ncbi:MAG: hypothetical protein MUC68_11050 [Burkholderiaceae bacterium]|jgi:hypothetical protein|nr:hypothetical protein [Burkholderiaceae bacterium]